MMDLKTIKRAVEQIAEEKGIEPEKILGAVEDAIAHAYKKEYEKKGELIRAKIDLKTGELKFWQVKIIADESTVRMVEKENEDLEGTDKTESREAAEGENSEPKLPRYNPDHHVLFEEARKVKPDAALGEELLFPLQTREDFGRIAAQTAKQVILQRLREAERESVLKEFQDKVGEVISGVVQRFERGNVYVDLGRAVGVMFPMEAIPGEHYRPGERLRFYLAALGQDARGSMVSLSRSNPKFVSKLFAVEVPEVSDGVVEIKAIAREAGSRTKIAVVSKTDGVDPVGSCVGQRGTRVMAVSNELGQEKIDIIEWSDDPAKFIGNSLSPAKVTEVAVLPRREARVLVPEDQLSLAIGRGGQNVRLAAKLTGWKIDVRSQARPDDVQSEGVAADSSAGGGTETTIIEEKKDPEEERTVE